MATPSRNWSTQTGSSMVSIGSHRLFVSVSGPPRTTEPLVIILAGAGDVASSYTALSPLVVRFSRMLLYDRTGLGRSEPGPQRSTAVQAAKDLRRLLEVMVLGPPLLLVAHSYGAIVAREYFHLYAGDVVGMVLAEGSTERQCDYFRLPDPNIDAVLGNLKVAQVTGLRADSKLSRDEWRERAIDIARGAVAAQAEADSLVEVCRSLGEKKQFQQRAMGDRPVSVIRCNGTRDFERIYQHGVAAGNGSVQQQQEFRRLLDQMEAIDQDLKEEQLQLSSRVRLVHLPDCGHNVHLVRPDVVAGEIQWVWEQLQSARVSTRRQIRRTVAGGAGGSRPTY
ncbi:alpha/beta hydrolase fold protein [Penicillium hispanicum]|uniref:alpha/beta hydrolase fold protein n=1 Tax=Penicillium hispanicum TaxID=1080232 RepID=UPI002540F525|nr:alpha/beta hydrolase fold protein [Penicillium hispanicum]KAJ5578284.1 alpha/beta hydrolase fold protein [Penicillium hispanicum]